MARVRRSIWGRGDGKHLCWCCSKAGGGEEVVAEAGRVWAGGGGTVMGGQFSPQNTSTGADSRPKMLGKAHRMAIYKNREMVSEP